MNIEKVSKNNLPYFLICLILVFLFACANQKNDQDGDELKFLVGRDVGSGDTLWIPVDTGTATLTFGENSKVKRFEMSSCFRGKVGGGGKEIEITRVSEIELSPSASLLVEVDDKDYSFFLACTTGEYTLIHGIDYSKTNLSDILYWGFIIATLIIPIGILLVSVLVSFLTKRKLSQTG